MSALLKPDYYSLEEYYSLEKGSDRRFEYWGGAIICMSGGTRAHGTVTSNAHRLLSTMFFTRGCSAYTEGQAVKADVTASGYVYPDASAACTPIFEKHPDRGIDLLVNPVLIVEVTSAESGLRDHNHKRDSYMRIPTLRDYLIIEPESAYIVHYRFVDNEWKKRVYDCLSDTIDLISIDTPLTLKDIYYGLPNRQK